MRHAGLSRRRRVWRAAPGAAPRQRGSSEKCTLSIGTLSSSELRNDRAVGHDDAALHVRCRRGRRDGARPSGRAESAAAFTGSAPSAPPRPRRRSGRVTTSATSWPASHQRARATVRPPRACRGTRGASTRQAVGGVRRGRRARKVSRRLRRIFFASFFCSSSSRSISRTPSRWSTSC